MNRVATFSRGIASLKHGAALIGCEQLVYWPLRPGGIDAVVGWGHKGNTMIAIEFAHEHGLPYFRLEDGFLRSVGLGVEGDTALSMVMDDEGMYYDARRPSRLESMLASGDALDEPELLSRASSAIAAITEYGLSKYNNSPTEPLGLPANGGRQRVLVVDQTAGDLSVACGYGKQDSFERMLDAAHRENPNAEIIVKTHPDVLSGKRQGYLGALAPRERQRVIADPCNPIRLLQQVDRVYVVTSQLGFEALLANKPVTCFGAPFYSGWGLTDDRRPIQRRTRKRSLEQVFAAAYMRYSTYVDPDTGERCELERVIEHLVQQRQEFARNEGRIFCFGFIKHFWKQNYVRAYLRSPGNTVVFPYSVSHAEKLGFDGDSKIVVWGRRAQADVKLLSSKYGVQPWCMEDGFLRSIGLGSDMEAPASLVVDREGIYFDPTGPSELESLLEGGVFSSSLLVQARSLRERLLHSGLSKYNVGDAKRSLPIEPGARDVVLVPGQVEDDASIKLGCLDISTNLGLLRAAREARPEAYIVFKPHPDVLSGNRRGNIPTEQALMVCDHIEVEASLAQCLRVADEVHVMTSLVGFEALLRGLSVHTYGQPFYASWGLTTDRHPVRRRSRTLSIDELVAGTYLLYPRYLNRETQRFTSAFHVVDQLEADRATNSERLNVSWPQRQLRKLRNIAKAVAGVETRRGA